jgi:hypothetical protein
LFDPVIPRTGEEVELPGQDRHGEGVRVFGRISFEGEMVEEKITNE